MTALRTSDRMRAILDRVSLPVYLAERPEGDSHFLFSLVNRAQRDLSGLTDRDPQGSSAFDILPDDHAARLEARYRAVLARRLPEKYTRTFKVDGAPKRWRTLLMPFPGRAVEDRVLSLGLPLPETGTEDAADMAKRDLALQSAATLLRAAQLVGAIGDMQFRAELPETRNRLKRAEELGTELESGLMRLAEVTRTMAQTSVAAPR